VSPSNPSPIALLFCPLCLEKGQRVAILAEYDLSTPIVTVADLVGCVHADLFGQTIGLTVDEERRMIQAALDMWDASRDEEEGEAGGRAGSGEGA
jgi:hypothetical protein